MLVPRGTGCNSLIPTTMPIGASTNELGSCSPCAEQPTDCLKSISELNAIVCQLKGQYAEMLRKYGTLQSKFYSQTQYLKQFLDEQTRLRRLISETDSGGACGGTSAETADSIMVCDGGTPKPLVPGSNCADIVGMGGKWKVVPHGLAWHPLAEPQDLVIGDNTTLTDYDDIKKIGCDIWGAVRFQHFMIGTSTAAGGTMLFKANDFVFGAEYISNGSSAAMAGLAIFPMDEKKITLSLTASLVGSVTQSSQEYELLGYFA